jgi:hypothetical protein
MFSPQVTLTTALTVYNLATLVAAVDSTFPGYCHTLTIQSDLSNTNNVYIGDANLSATVYGTILQTIGSSEYTSPFNGVDLHNFYIMCDGGVSAKLNITAFIL